MKRNLLIMSTVLMLSACGTVDKINPFSESSNDELSLYKNASKYSCANKQSFYLRMHDNGQSAWVIFPDYEVNLIQSEEDKQQFVNGAMTLTLGEDVTTLTDGVKAAYSSCSTEK